MKSSSNIPVITFDGLSGTGKGTISAKLAKHLSWHYLESGAIYRSLAWACDFFHLQADDTPGLLSLIGELELRFSPDGEIICNQHTITTAIRTETVAALASSIAAIPEVRHRLLEFQRDFRKMPGLVCDGRDMGTVVFPDATLKFYLLASTEERAKRRYQQLKALGKPVDLAQISADIEARDQRDQERSASPAKPATDAIEIDTTKLTVEAVFQYVLECVNNLGVR